MHTIYHITSNKAYENAKASGHYISPTFADDGFIHCSYRHQVLRVANTRFRGIDGLVLLGIDKNKIDDDIIDENLEGGEELFPHIYGPLPIDAVVTVKSFVGDSDGEFTIPL